MLENLKIKKATGVRVGGGKAKFWLLFNENLLLTKLSSH